MFENFSVRAKSVIFGTRIKAGRRGAEFIDVGDLLFAIVLEDQDMTRELTGHEGDGQIGRMQGWEPHTPFFSKSSASDLLAGLETLLPRSSPIPNSRDMPISAELRRVFESAEGGLRELHHKQVEPLHLLAAALELPSRPEVDLLRRAGINEEDVRAKLKELY
jgi:ATP-dependent Clp protease ATP-binding subunit ClpA